MLHHPRGSCFNPFKPPDRNVFGLLQWHFRGHSTVNGEHDIRWLQIFINSASYYLRRYEGLLAPINNAYSVKKIRA